MGVLIRCSSAFADLDDIVRRDVRRHAHGDAGRAVGEQVGECGRQDHRFFAFAIIGLAEIDGILVEAAHQFGGDLGQARFGVSHRGGVIAVDVAEVALPVDQRVALREILREADQRVIDRLVAMRVIFADDVADDARALLEAGRRIELELLHRPEKAAVDGLEAVAHVGQRAGHDRGQRIGEIAFAKRILEIDWAHIGGERGGHIVCCSGKFTQVVRRHRS